MKTLRQLHLYLGCVFAPLILYFSISGAWQVYRFNDVPKGEPASALRTALHELSKPHTNSTLPGLSSKTERSAAFNAVAVAMALGLCMTAVLGLVLAFRFTKSPRLVLLCVLGGILLPLALLFVR